MQVRILSDPAAIETLIKPHVTAALTPLDGDAPELAGMVRYHLGMVDEKFRPIDSGSVDQGKRLRPAIALLTCAAAGGDPADAAPLAAAIELLHNFTLIHDDIQDRSPLRRHRPTVWAIWGESQAINAGDALFAASHLALYRLAERGIPADVILDLAAAFDRMTIEIVRGQVLDLSFEGSNHVSAAGYIEMIRCKTAAILRYAAWAGALLGGAGRSHLGQYGDFGEALGIGFQIRDDTLGIWGESGRTGKTEADDIRRRKQTLPVILLRNCLEADERQTFDRIYSMREIDSAGIETILALMSQHGIRSIAEQTIVQYHNDARTALTGAVGETPNSPASTLFDLVDAMAIRTG